MQYIVRGIIIFVCFCLFLQVAGAATYIGGDDSSLTVFQKLSIQLTDKIASTQYAGDGLLIQGRVTNKKEYAFFYLQNVKTKEETTQLVRTDRNGNFKIPVSLPKGVGKYYLILASGNSFESSSPEIITLISNTNSVSSDKIADTLYPKMIYDDVPYISVGPNKWVTMKIGQSKKVYQKSGKILTFNDPELSLGKAQVNISGYTLSTVSSMDIIPDQPVAWSGTIIIDRTRERIGEKIPTLRVQRSMGTMRFRVKNGERVESHYFLTTPTGDVIKYNFPASMIASDGFLRTNIMISQNFPMPESGVYKIETVKDNGIAYFNLPISKHQFWSIVEPMTQLQKVTLRTKKGIIDTSIIKKINNIRAGLQLKPLEIDPKLSDLAQQKALDMATYNYVGHTTHGGLGILDFGDSVGIKLTGSIGENVAGGNISDISLQDGLEESGSHRYNMINPKWQHIGIGYVLDNGRTYLVQLFSE